MSIIRNGLFGAAIVLACLVTGAAAGQAQTLASLPSDGAPAAAFGDATALPAWTEFCGRYPSECTLDLSEPTTISLTPKIWQTIVAVNRKVNAAITPMTDLEHWGVPDRWDIPTDGYGDCEDYQLLKRKLLAEAGLPRRAMRMTVVLDEKREGHAVLLVRTNRGDLALDNKSDSVLAWYETGYTYVKRESQDAIGWVSLGRAVSPLTTANRR